MSRAATAGTRSNWRVAAIARPALICRTEFLAAARAELDADWRKGDMRALDLEPAAFDGAFCFGNSFGYLDHAGVAAFLSALAGALKPGAKLVIETGMCAESILPTLVQKRWHRLDDLLILSENRYDPWESRLNIDYTFVSRRDNRNAADGAAMSSPLPNFAGCWMRRASTYSRYTGAWRASRFSSAHRGW